ncbi:hypothetical protein SLS63_004764 [Diaporthe eres]|uniref:Uncharacterized protein n=1 Tax=Diaporthe eres TaxID=83184 RepID=A0ABR1PCY5_DIAER
MEIIDLTSDDDLPASAIVDLTSVDDLRASSHVSREREVKVEDESSTLAGSSTADSGGSSPSTQRDDDIAQTESNPTDVGDLSPRNPQDQGGSSADEGLSLSTILARGKKRKRDSGDAHTSESTSTEMSKPLTPKALDSLVGSQSLKPGLNNFFSAHKRVVNESHSEKSKQDERPKTAADESARIQMGMHSAMNANPHILNIDREEVFGKEKKKKKRKHHGDPSSQEKPAKQHIQKATSGRNDGLQEARGGRGVLGSGATGTQFPLKSNYDRDEGLYEPIEESYGLEPGGKGSQVPLESKAGYKARVGQNEDLRKDREMPDLGLQPQQVHPNGGQQESHIIQSKLNTAQAARRLDQRQQTMGLADKDLEDTRDFFRKHPSQLAHQHKTMFLESIPPDVGKPSYLDRRRLGRTSTGKRKHKAAIQTAKKRAKDREQQIRKRRERLWAQVNEMFPNESEESKERRVQAGVAELLKIHARNDEKREAEKAQGLLTVKFIEDREGAEDDLIDGQRAPAPKGKSRGVPVAKALEPGATITLYVVYKSEPFEKGKKFGDYGLNRMEDQFFRKEDANKHAEAVLRNDRYDDSHLVSIQFRVGPEDGLFFGTKELANGKLVMCMVQKERQMSSDLDLRDIFVRKELKQIYCPRYDVFHTHVVPKVFESEEGDIDGDKEKKSKSKSKKPSPDVGEGGPESGENEHVDGDSDSLFSGPPTPETGSEDGSDADSTATSATLEPSQPGGNMGSLSWKDVDYVHEHVGSFTTLELANKEALKVALERWQPRNARLDSWLHYRDSIKPSLKEIWAQDLDVDKAELEFEVPEFEGHVNDRPWRFIYSTVYVRETKLEGPRDIGNHIVSGNGDNDGEQSGGEDGGDDEDGEDD